MQNTANYSHCIKKMKGKLLFPKKIKTLTGPPRDTQFSHVIIQKWRILSSQKVVKEWEVKTWWQMSIIVIHWVLKYLFLKDPNFQEYFTRVTLIQIFVKFHTFPLFIRKACLIFNSCMDLKSGQDSLGTIVR